MATSVLAVPIGPDGLGGSFQNDVGTRRASDWWELGGRAGVLSGLSWAQVTGLMALDLAAGAAMVPVRDASAVVQSEGYMLRTTPGSATVRVFFTPASASARNDALIGCVADTSIGSAGTGGLANGGWLAVVPGVSGTVTPRTDAQINAWVGGGGWDRYADVPIASTDTQINTANIANKAWQLRGWNTLPFTAASGFSWTTAQYRISSNGMVSLNLSGTYTGAGITSDGTGNIGGDPNMMTGLPAAILPPSAQFRGINVDRLGVQMFRGFVDGSVNALRLGSAITPSISIPTGTGLQITDSYYP